MNEGDTTIVTTGDANQDPDSEVATLAQVVKAQTDMVRAYATKLINDDRAKEYAARVNLMVRQEPKIRDAIEQAPDTFLSAMIACVHLDLMPNTPEQLAYIIPYKNGGLQRMEIQFQVGYKGLVKLAQRSGEILTLDAELVYKGDKFEVSLGSERKLTHVPDFDVDRTDYSKVTHAYATAKLLNGESTFIVMSRKELDKIQDTVKSSGSETPWKKWPEAQARKTVIKRFTKLLPSSTKDNKMALAAELDSRAEMHKLVVDQDGNFVDKKLALPELSKSDKAAIAAESADIANKLRSEGSDNE